MRVGLIGFPVNHSISPAFQQAAFDALGLDVRYELWETPPERVSASVEQIRRPDCLGANVTIPHKLAVMEYLDEIDGSAAGVGAVNTIVRQPDGRLVGFNTDVEGFTRAIREDGQAGFKGQRITLLGAGGAARAVAVAALVGGAARLSICARRPLQAASLLATLAEHGLVRPETRTEIIALDDASGQRERAIRDCDILINATPVGMTGHSPRGIGETAGDLLVQPEWLSPATLVCDLIYNPPLTPLLERARARGARALNGLPMLIYQGAAAFERWTGQDAPVALMREKAREALRG